MQKGNFAIKIYSMPFSPSNNPMLPHRSLYQKNHPITPPTTKTAAVNITYLPNNPIIKPIFPPLHPFISSCVNNKTPVPRQAFYSYRRPAGTTPFILLSSLPQFTHSQSPVPWRCRTGTVSVSCPPRLLWCWQPAVWHGQLKVFFSCVFHSCLLSC